MSGFSFRPAPSLRNFGALFVVFVLGAFGCDRPENEVTVGGVVEKQAAAPTPEPFELKADAKGILFVWVGGDGDFHTTDQPSQIEEAARKEVRVLDPERGAGTPENVWVTDVSALGGVFRVHALLRSVWEAKGQPARAARVQAAEPKVAAAPVAAELADVTVTIYGASWCKACHMAEDYLKAKGIRVVKKDIEEDPGAQGEMAAKLRRAGQGGSSIPVIDVAGTILVGFSESALNAALARAKK